jgi:hypothetical protein
MRNELNARSFPDYDDGGAGSLRWCAVRRLRRADLGSMDGDVRF